MKKNLFLGALTALTLSLTSCGFFNILSPNEVSESFWTEHISQGGVFSDKLNFSFIRKDFENDEQASSGYIENDNGKIHVSSEDESINEYFVLTNQGYDYIYPSDDGYLKEVHKEIGTFRDKILDYTIQYPFAYRDFSYNSEKQLYSATNLTVTINEGIKGQEEQITYDYVEFSFYDNLVRSFALIQDGYKITLETVSVGSTHVTVPDAEVIDYSNPYRNTRHLLSNLEFSSDSDYSSVQKEFSNSYLYLVGDEYHLDGELVSFVSSHLVFIYYLSISQYNSRTKSFTVTLEKRQGFGSEYIEDYTKRYSGEMTITEDTFTLIYEIFDESIEQTTTINIIGNLTSKEEVHDLYEYESESSVLKNLINKKIFTADSISPRGDIIGPAIFDNSFFLVYSENYENYAEFHINKNITLIGYAEFGQYDGEHFKLNLQAEVDKDTLLTNKRTRLYLEAELKYNSKVNVVFSYDHEGNGYIYEGSFSMTDEIREPMYLDIYTHRYEVTKERWNSFYNDINLIYDGMAVNYYKGNNSDRNEAYQIAFANNRIRYGISNPDSGEFEYTYYEITETTTYVYTFSEYGGWRKTTTTPLSEDYLMELFKIKNPFDYDEATFGGYEYTLSNTRGYDNVRILFDFQVLSEVTTHYGDEMEIINYTFESINIELPDLG